jgi:hypothetical protein
MLTDSFFEKSKNESDIDKSAESDGYLPCDNSSTSGVNTQETHGHYHKQGQTLHKLPNHHHTGFCPHAKSGNHLL